MAAKKNSNAWVFLILDEEYQRLNHIDRRKNQSGCQVFQALVFQNQPGFQAIFFCELFDLISIFSLFFVPFQRSSSKFENKIGN